MLKLLVFDWDDVIILGSKEGYYKCYKETLKELGIVLSDDEFHGRIQKRWGQPFKEELRELLLEHPAFLEQAVGIYTRKKFVENTFLDCLYEVSGANEILMNLSKKYTLAVATANHRQMLEEKIIPKFHIPPVFKRILTAYEVPNGKSKPDRYMLELIMHEQKVKPEECVYIGDAENDVGMARNASVEPIVVLTGHLTRAKAEELGVSKIIPDITHLEEVI